MLRLLLLHVWGPARVAPSRVVCVHVPEWKVPRMNFFRATTWTSHLCSTLHHCQFTDCYPFRFFNDLHSPISLFCAFSFLIFFPLSPLLFFWPRRLHLDICFFFFLLGIPNLAIFKRLTFTIQCTIYHEDHALGTECPHELGRRKHQLPMGPTNMRLRNRREVPLSPGATLHSKEHVCCLRNLFAMTA